jgi:hypothetical protein
MKTQLQILPGNTRTEEKYLKPNDQFIKIIPFPSSIEGLYLCLQNANGNGKKIPIKDTKRVGN